MANAQPRATAARVRSLSDDVLRIDAEFSRGVGFGQQQLQGQAADILRERAKTLATLIKESPEQALSLALSPELLAGLNERFPDASAYLEHHGSWAGEIEYRIYDDLDGRRHWSEISINAGPRKLNLHFAGPEPRDLSCGDRLEATGIVLDGEMAVSGSTLTASSLTSTAATTQAVCTTTGVQNTAVLLVNLPNSPLPSTITAQTMRELFFATSGQSLDGYFREVSYGRASAAGEVYGPYTLTGNYSGCNSYQMQNDAVAAAAAQGVNFQNYTRLFVVFPDTIGCGWSGMASVGCSSQFSPTGSFTASSAFLAAQFANVQVASHEAGHTLRLRHAQSRDFGAEALGPVGAAGTLNEYGDQFSTMGGFRPGHYAAPHKAQTLGWMTEGADYQTVQTSGTFVVQPLELNSAGMRALRIQRGTGSDNWLWLEYRQPMGSYDPSFYTTQPYSGALVHYQDATTGAYSQLLDFTPGSDLSNGDSSDFGDPALTAGKTWTDPYTNLSFTINSATSSGLSVTVNYGATPCSRANPTVSLSPPNPSVTAGSPVEYTVMIVNQDGAGCPSASFDLSAPKPVGWTVTFAQPALTLGPGQSASTVMRVTPPATTPAAMYTVEASATSGSFTGLGSANCTVVSAPALTVSLSVNGSVFSRRSTVAITATLMNGGTAAAGATVTFTLSKPNGTQETKSVVADSAGKASWSYRFSQKDPTGNYSATAQATSGSQTAASNTVAFSLQ